MTPTGRLAADAREPWQARPARASPPVSLTIDAITLLRGDRAVPFRIVRRIPFTPEAGFATRPPFCKHLRRVKGLSGVKLRFANAGPLRAFSSDVDTGSREENATSQQLRANPVIQGSRNLLSISSAAFGTRDEGQKTSAQAGTIAGNSPGQIHLSYFQSPCYFFIEFPRIKSK